MVNTVRLLEGNSTGGEVAKYHSFPATMKILGVSRPTLYKLLAEGVIRARKDDISGRTTFKFNFDEVDRVKDLMVKKRKKGKSIIKGGQS